MPKSVWMSWSSGKDSAWTLFQLQNSKEFTTNTLVTTINSDLKRVAMHSTRLELLQLQAQSLGLKLKTVSIPQKCSNEIYQNRFIDLLKEADTQQVDHMAYGDLFLEDIKNYRVNLHQGLSIQPLFPLWQAPTQETAQQIIEQGFEAYVTCIDSAKLPQSFVGRKFDSQFLADLPKDVDPCGENGEFHTFVYNGPNFKFPLACKPVEIVERDRFIFADIVAL